MSRYIDANALYEKTAEWEAQALHEVERHMNDEDSSEWRRWSTILKERSAFKFDVADAPTADVVEVVRCKDCKHWRQQTDYQGVPLSFGFCESDDMWLSLYGETCEVSHIDTDDDFYCGYAERKTDE